MEVKIEGVDFPMYGEYKCPGCHHRWNSCKSWKDFGQKCNRCSNESKAIHMEKLFYYHCKECKFTMKNKESPEGLFCKRCNGCKVYPKSYQVYKAYVSMVEGDERNLNNRGSHKHELCRKCLAFGGECWASSSSLYRSRPNLKEVKIVDFSLKPKGRHEYKGKTSRLTKEEGSRRNEMFKNRNYFLSEQKESRLRMLARQQKIAQEREEERRLAVKRHLKRRENIARPSNRRHY